MKKNSLRTHTLKFSILFIVICAATQIIAYSIVSYVENEHRSKVNDERLTQYLSEGIIEPLSLGNHIEALRRIEKLRESKVILCAKIIIEGKEIGDCSFLNSVPIYSSTNNIPSNLEKKFDFKVQYNPVLETNYVLIKVFTFALIFIISSLGLFGYLRRVFNSISSDLDNVVMLVRDDDLENKKFSWVEFQLLYGKLEKIIVQNIHRNSNERILNLSRQLAHDIRSPLSVINLMMPVFVKNPTAENANLINQSVKRINDISQDLLSESSLKNNENSIVTTLKNIIKEKELSLPVNTNIFFNNRIEENKEIITSLNISDLARIVSNLLNNAIEAPKKIGDKNIEVSLNIENKKLMIAVEDNCDGIPLSIVSKIGTEGFSYNKKNDITSSGIGIYNAKQIIEASGGSLQLKSEEGVGTMVLLNTPILKIN